LLQTVGVAGNRTSQRIKCTQQANVPRIRCRLYAVNDRLDYRGKLDRRNIEAKLSADNARDIEEIVNQPTLSASVPHYNFERAF
jgi:hypothetical protein